MTTATEGRKALHVTIDGKDVSPEVQKKVSAELKKTLSEQLHRTGLVKVARAGDVSGHARW